MTPPGSHKKASENWRGNSRHEGSGWKIVVIHFSGRGIFRTAHIRVDKSIGFEKYGDFDNSPKYLSVYCAIPEIWI
jgi:hypothetical protein